jgi:hypothetical protein
VTGSLALMWPAMLAVFMASLVEEAEIAADPCRLPWLTGRLIRGKQEIADGLFKFWRGKRSRFGIDSQRGADGAAPANPRPPFVAAAHRSGFGRVKHLRVSRLREYHVARKANNPVTMVITSNPMADVSGQQPQRGNSERAYPI